MGCRSRVCCCLKDYRGAGRTKDGADEESDDDWVDDGGNDEATVEKRKKRREKLAARKAAEDAAKSSLELENEKIDRCMEMPQDELARLRKGLAKKGYSVRARPMLGHV